MKIDIIKDELYPVYFIRERLEGDREISQELYDKYRSVMERFDLLQDELEKLL